MQIEEPYDFDDIEHPLDLDLFVEGERNYDRAKRLSKSWNGDANFLKGVIVQFDLRYPQYLGKQLQRYNFIDIVSSQSTMHRITAVEDIKGNCNNYVLPEIIDIINGMIYSYNNYDLERPFAEKSKQELFQYIISNLPMGYMLWMGVTTNYLQLKTIYKQRKNHKLDDWKEFCRFIEGLQMSELIINNK